MTQFDNTNRGIISKNTRKESDKHPDVKGQINVAGVDYWLDGWLKQKNDGSGTFYSLSVKPKDSAAPAPASKPTQKQSAGGLDDDIPF